MDAETLAEGVRQLALNQLPGKFRAAEISVDRIRLRREASLPGGQQAITKRILRDLVGAEKEPVLVRPVGDVYEVIAGDVEFMAAVTRGEKTVSVLVGDISDEDALILRLSQAGKRGDVNVVEEADIIRVLNQEYGMTQQEIAMRCGKVQSTVANKMRLLKLPCEALERLRAGEIGERHARALLKLNDEKAQLDMLNRCIKRGLSASEVESLCAGIAGSSRMHRGKMKKGFIKDARIYQNALRSVVREMRKAGLDVACEEEMDDNSWQFRILVRGVEKA